MIDICEELSQNFIDFSYEANSERAFPDARDGLKPGQRACLWEMYTKGYSSNKPHVKSAKISGGVIANWHPHGDVAVYETFARMSQPWINNVPEVDWHGANGNQIIGNAPANQRYTEARLSKASEEGLLQGLKKHCVPMKMNFSEDDEMPVVLPAIFPRLMVNGSQGIGVTIANVWLCHSLREISQVIIHYIQTGELDYSNLFPDFPTGGTIINKDDIPVIYKTGKGKVIVRATAECKKNSIFITELPYQVFAEPLIDSIKELVRTETISGIKDILNKSDKNRLLIEIECSENPEFILDRLYSLSDLQKSYSANQWALVGKTPKLLTLLDYVQIYIQHNLNCLKNETQFDLNKAQARKEIVDGLLKCLINIDDIIALIKKSESSSNAKERLISIYNFTENQAKAIVEMKLGKLAKLESVELEKEGAELIKTIDSLTNLLQDENAQKEVLIQRLSSFAEKYGRDRKTAVTQIDIKPEEKEKANIIPEDVAVIVSQNGEIKRIPAASFKIQKRKGKGVKTEDKAIMTAFATNTLDTLLIFTSKGKMYRTVVNNIPAGTSTSKGTPISTLIKLDDVSEKVVAVTSLATGTDAKYILFVTKNGMLKKSALEEYFKTKRNCGIIAINLKDDDSIASIAFVNDEDIVLASKKGFASHIKTSDIAPTGRVTLGVKGMKLEDNDYILSAMVVEDESEDIATFLSSGEGKRVSLKELPPQGRNGKGLTIFKPQGSEELINVLLVKDENNLLIIGKPNSICISAKDLPIMTTRTAKGNLLIENSKIVSVTKI